MNTILNVKYKKYENIISKRVHPNYSLNANNYFFIQKHTKF